MRRRLILFGVGGALVGLVAGSAPAIAAPEPLPYQGNGDIGGFRNVLPPGQGQTVNAAELGAFRATGARPPHDHDQHNMYADLVHRRTIPAAEIDDYFKDASFGVRPTQRERTYSPREDVTIVRDHFGVPHIYGADRPAAMFGAGYVSAEDRLFFMDVLRHAGRAQLSSFAGGSNTEMDQEVWADTPYTEDELQLQYELGDDLYGAEGAQLQADVQSYVAGVNAYIDEARRDSSKMPGEYAAINRPEGAEEWKVTDVIATASLVAGIFGKGGGGEIRSALVLDQARKRFGRRAGKRVWRDFRSAEDPEAPKTVRGKRFIYGKKPKRTPGRALFDRRTLADEPLVVAASGSGETSARRLSERGSESPLGDVLSPLRSRSGGGSNALLVSGSESESGRPVAVMGPQVSYFSPQILMEQSIHAPEGAAGPPLDARGSAFPGTNLYVQLGRGRNYSWSATSAGQDIIDTFAVPLCEPGGGKARLGSQGYRYRGRCLPFEVLERTNTWSPSAGDDTPSGSQTLRALRTKLGIVTHRARIDGKPHAYTRLRATYFHEVDSALGFADFNNPRKMRTPRKFMRAACKIDYTFNWFYINHNKIAYFNSGANPKRSRGADPNFPAFGKPRFEWRGYVPPSDEIFKPEPLDPANVNPRSMLSKRERCRKRPQTVDQRFLTSWNNDQARGYRAADDEWGFQPVDRVQPLDKRIRRAIHGERKISPEELIWAMNDAGSVDLRGDRVLPWALKVIGKARGAGSEVRAALATLREWVRTGNHRRDRNRDGSYDHRRAARIMDAWWPRLVRAQFKPTLGGELFKRIQTLAELDDHPGDNDPNQGSAFGTGWYGYAQKDLRAVLGRNVRGRYSRLYCGKGKLRSCRKALVRSLERALAVPRNKLYEEQADRCDIGDAQMCHDAVEYRSLGGITQPSFPWVNRPTFQQVVEAPDRPPNKNPPAE